MQYDACLKKGRGKTAVAKGGSEMVKRFFPVEAAKSALQTIVSTYSVLCPSAYLSTEHIDIFSSYTLK